MSVERKQTVFDETATQMLQSEATEIRELRRYELPLLDRGVEFPRHLARSVSHAVKSITESKGNGNFDFAERRIDDVRSDKRFPEGMNTDVLKTALDEARS